jgi:hypothetical protein
MERDGENPDDPRRVERRLDEAPVEGARHGGVEREGLQGTDRAVERERIAGREADVGRQGLERGRGSGREDAIGASRAGELESRPGDDSDPMPGEELH